MISTSQARDVHFEQMVNRWHMFDHPHVIKLFGACHIGKPRFFVYEDLPNGTLLEYLRVNENGQLTWQKLFEAAVGIQYLHEQGVVHGELQSGNLVVGRDLATKIAGFGETSLRLNSENRLWESPELHPGGNMSFAHDIFVFGMCMLEILTDACTKEERDIYFPAVSREWTPKNLPPGMDSSQWNLVKLMCRSDPAQRVNIMFVVKELERFALEASGASSGLMPVNRVAGDWAKSSRMDLEKLKVRSAAFPDRVSAAKHILARLENVLTMLTAMDNFATDLKVIKFGDIVARFEQYYARTTLSEKSTTHLARSRQVIQKNNVLHLDLDRLLAMMNVVVDADPVHKWDHASSSTNSEGGSSLEPEPESLDLSSDDKSSGDPVTLNVFESDAKNPAHGVPENHPAHGPVSINPSWFLSISDLSFDQRDCIASGAFGEVYRGMWLSTPVIVKFMGCEGDPDKVSTRLFLHEVRIWYQLNHPHVVKLYGACHFGKRYFACEYASNGTLSEYLSAGKNAGSVWKKLHETALGLQYVHGKDIVHNDLKCDNILIGAGGNAKLSDFGLSSIPNVAEIMIGKSKIGAVNWKSPEYLAGGRPTFASDVYSFAMCILEAVTGTAMSGTMVRYHVKKGNTPKKPESMSNKQWRLVQQMTALDPTKRARISYVVEKLEEFVDESQAPYVRGGGLAEVLY